MDRDTIKKVVGKTPSGLLKVIVPGRSKPLFVLYGNIIEITNDSIIFKSKTKTAAVLFSEILEIVNMETRP